MTADPWRFHGKIARRASSHVLSDPLYDPINNARQSNNDFPLAESRLHGGSPSLGGFRMIYLAAFVVLSC